MRILFLIPGLLIFLNLTLTDTFAENDLTIESAGFDASANKNPFKPLLPDTSKPAVVENNNSTPTVTETPAAATPIIQKQEIVPPSFNITGIVWNTDRPQAIINGQVITQGDTLSGAKIVSIRKSSIEILYQDTNFTIKP